MWNHQIKTIGSAENGGIENPAHHNQHLTLKANIQIGFSAFKKYLDLFHKKVTHKIMEKKKMMKNMLTHSIRMTDDG